MAEYDLTALMVAHMDRHLVLRMLESLQERKVYADAQILQGKIRLLGGTNMVDYAMDIHKSLHGTEDVPASMVARRSEVIERLRTLQEAAAPIVAFLSSPQLVQDLGADTQHNIQMLQDRHQIGPDQIEALYQYAKFQFECGMYSEAADFLSQYRALCRTDGERSLSAMWGKLAAEILTQNWDVTQEELNLVKETIDSNSFSSINQLHGKVWLMHWSLFLFFNHGNGKNGIIDLFFQERYLNAIQTNAPHLLRYLAVAVVLNKRRNNMLRELIRVIQQEQQSYYKDPITEFLECLYVKHDFDGALQKLVECERVILNDPFLGKQRIEEGNFIAVPLRDEFLENARLLVLENYCRVHRSIDIGVLAEKMNMVYGEAELWMVNLVKSSKLDAKIDLAKGTLVMTTTDRVDVHERIIQSMENLNARTSMLAKSLVAAW